MRKPIVICSFVALVFAVISCTSDDTPIPAEESQTRVLIESTQNIYDTDTGDLKETVTDEYENNLVKKTSIYNVSGELTYHNQWTYNNDNLLSMIETYLPNGELNYELKVAYDDSNRIILLETSEDNGTYNTSVSFEYSTTEGVVMAIKTLNGHTSIKSYHLNNNGIIFKVTVDGVTTEEAVYDNDNNVVSMSNGSVNYTYLDKVINTDLPRIENMLGSKNNVVLWGEFLQDYASTYGNKYVESVSFANGVTRYEYEFDDQDFPLKISIYYSGKLYSVTEIKYQF